MTPDPAASPAPASDSASSSTSATRAPAAAGVGILGLGTYVPDTHHTAAEIAEASGTPEWVVEEKMGLKRKRIPDPDAEGADGTIAMGVKAARVALDRGGVRPDEIDLVLWAGEEHRERPMQTACIKVQKELGIPGGWGFDLSVRCGSVIAAIKVAKDLMTVNDDLGTVLVVSGYRNSDLVDYSNPRTRFLYGLAAGGAAVVLRKGLGRNLVLEGAFRTEGSFSDDVYVPAGGTAEPITPEALEQNRHKLDVLDPEGMKERLDELSMDHFVGVVLSSLRKSGYAETDIDYLAILHMKRSAHDHVLKTLGLEEDQAIYLDEFGHMGQNDPIVSLELALEEGKVADGSVVVLVAAGIGYVWDAITLRWGPADG